MRKIYGQHGDVILSEIPQRRSGFSKKEISDGFILERGEGLHTHVLEKVDKKEVLVNEKGEIIFRSGGATKINHQEHGPKILEKKEYLKTIENEYDAEADETRKVID